MPRVVIDVSRAHLWDIAAVSALDKAVMPLRRQGAQAEVLGAVWADRAHDMGTLPVAGACRHALSAPGRRRSPPPCCGRCA